MSETCSFLRLSYDYMVDKGQVLQSHIMEYTLKEISEKYDEIVRGAITRPIADFTLEEIQNTLIEGGLLFSFSLVSVIRSGDRVNKNFKLIDNESLLSLFATERPLYYELKGNAIAIKAESLLERITLIYIFDSTVLDTVDNFI